MYTRTIVSDIRLAESKYALRINNIGSDLDSMFVTESTSAGLQIKLFDTEEEAKLVASTFAEGAIEIIQYVHGK